MPIPLREDHSAGDLRSSARQSKDSGPARRLLSLAAIYDGSTRTEAAKIGGVTLQIISFGTGFSSSTPMAPLGSSRARLRVRRRG